MNCVTLPTHSPSKISLFHTRYSQWQIQRGTVGRPPPPIGSYFFQKATFSRVKGIYFVVRICNKWGRSWQIIRTELTKFLEPPLGTVYDYVVNTRPRNDLLCVGWDVKLYSLTHLLSFCTWPSRISEMITDQHGDRLDWESVDGRTRDSWRSWISPVISIHRTRWNSALATGSTFSCSTTPSHSRHPHPSCHSCVADVMRARHLSYTYRGMTPRRLCEHLLTKNSV